MVRRTALAIVLGVVLIACGDDIKVAPPDAAPDASAPGTITLVGQLITTGLPVHDVWRYAPAGGGDLALLCAASAGLLVIDLADQAHPVEVGRIGGGAGLQATDVKTWRNYAYVVGEGPSLTGSIVDLSNPTQPSEVGSFPAAHNLFISDAGYLIASAPGLRIYDLNIDPLVPVQVYRDDACEGHDAIVAGDRLYDFAYDCGTRIFDFTTPSSPALLGTIVDGSFSHHSGWPSADGAYVFVTDELARTNEPDLRAYDIRDLGAPTRVSTYTDPTSYVHNLYVSGAQAFVSYYRAGFRVFDVSDPGTFTLLDEYDTDPQLSGPGFGGNFGIHASGVDGTILASDEENGLFLFNVAR